MSKIEEVKVKQLTPGGGHTGNMFCPKNGEASSGDDSGVMCHLDTWIMYLVGGLVAIFGIFPLILGC